LTPAVRLYDRFWTPDEIRGDSDMLRGLYRDPTLFRVSARNVETPLHGGPLSLKMVTQGESLYRFERTALPVRPGQVLIVPSSARYSTEVAEAGAEIVTFYFPSAWVTDAASVLTWPAAALLDGREAGPQTLSDFPVHHRAVSPRLAGVLSQLACGGQGRLADLTMDALQETVRLSLEATGAIARAPASRPSVRRELFRRAAQVRTAIEANPERNDGLGELGRIACLSPFHLHRVFRAAFGETPAEMRRRLRIAQAQRLLATSGRPVAEIVRSVGYQNDSAFSRAFYVAVGVTPMAFRRAAGA
jgi:AraC family transcriptional regulator